MEELFAILLFLENGEISFCCLNYRLHLFFVLYKFVSTFFM